MESTIEENKGEWTFRKWDLVGRRRMCWVTAEDYLVPVPSSCVLSASWLPWGEQPSLHDVSNSTQPWKQ